MTRLEGVGDYKKSKIFPHRQKLIPLVSISYSVLPSA